MTTLPIDMAIVPMDHRQPHHLHQTSGNTNGQRVRVQFQVVNLLIRVGMIPSDGSGSKLVGDIFSIILFA